MIEYFARTARALARRLTRRHPEPSPEHLIAVEAALRDLGQRHHLAEAPRGEPWHAGVNYGDPTQDPIGTTRYAHPDAWPWTKTGPDRWVPLTEQPWRADDDVRALVPGTQLRRRPARPPWPADTTTSEARRA